MRMKPEEHKQVDILISKNQGLQILYIPSKIIIIL